MRAHSSRFPLLAALAGSIAVALMLPLSPAAAADVPAATDPDDGGSASMQQLGGADLTPRPEVIANYPEGRYIVVLTDPAAVAPSRAGDALRRSAAVPDVSARLLDVQHEVAASVGVDTLNQLTLTTNGFVADLTSDQAAALSLNPLVQRVVKDEIIPLASTSADFLGLTGPDGVWAGLGGSENLGAGVVVGMIDSGIAPENPSFAGQPLTTQASDTEPYLDGDSIVYRKSDGGTFTGTCQAGDQFTAEDCSSKIIGAQYFSAGFPVIGSPEQGEYRSPRDGSGHGSHTSSTVAGDAGVHTHGETISGVTPGAKLAVYKVCWTGPLEEASYDDGCALSDILSAIDAATRDNVDVINYSIGGGAATTTVSLIDQAFLAAASSGIYVAAAAGNSGPDASTLDNASPWITTVAASTIPSPEGTLTLGDGQSFLGASSSVESTVSGPLVLATNVVSDNSDASSAKLCMPDTLDPAKVAGKIVVCERGVIARTQKSATVAAAGGIGMILVNPVANSLDADAHTLPTVHLDAKDYAAVTAYAGTGTGTASLQKGNPQNLPSLPNPQIAGFSSRGPVLADGSNILKPDVAAPGVGILAAINNAEGADPQWGFESGTSMASPHIAGFGTMYLSQHPNASPAEIKSAIMTTAGDTVDALGNAVQDPFAQGAGQVQPSRFLDPGLVYLTDSDDWLSYAATFGVVTDHAPMNPSDLNVPSIAIGAMNGKETVTRTVTAMAPGTYTATVEGMAGIDTTVEPAELTFAEAGESKTFTVTFTRTDAPVGQFATGYLRWGNTSGGNDVRSPMAVNPQAFTAPAFAAGDGATGSTSIETTFGESASHAITTTGLTRGSRASGSATAAAPQRFGFDLATPADLLLLDIRSTDGSTPVNVKLYGTDENYGSWVIGSSQEPRVQHRVTLPSPQPATYVVEISVPDGTTGSVPFELTSYLAGGTLPSQPLTMQPATVSGDTAEQVPVIASWNDLPGGAYMGIIRYGETGVTTVLTVDAGSTPADPGTPTMTTTPSVAAWLYPESLLRIRATGLTPGAAYAAHINDDAPLQTGTANEDGIVDWGLMLPADVPLGRNTVHLTGEGLDVTAPFRVASAQIIGGSAYLEPTFDGKQFATFTATILGDADVRITAVDTQTGTTVYNGVATEINKRDHSTVPIEMPAGTTVQATATIVAPDGVESPTYTYSPLEVGVIEPGVIAITDVTDGLASVTVNNPREYRENVTVEYRACDGSRRIAYDAFDPGASSDTWTLAGYVQIAVYDHNNRMLYSYANTDDSRCAERATEPLGQDVWVDLEDPSVAATDGKAGAPAAVTPDRPILGTVSYRYEPNISQFSLQLGQGKHGENTLIPAPGADIYIPVVPVQERGAVWSTTVALAENQQTWLDLVVSRSFPDFLYLWYRMELAPVTLTDLQPIDAGDLIPGVASIRGEGRVGETVTAQPGTWSAEGIAFTYQWNIDGAPIEDALGAELTIPGAAAGRNLTVTITGTAPDGRTATAQSRPLPIASLEPAPVTPPTAPDLPPVSSGGGLAATGMALPFAGIVAGMLLVAIGIIVTRRRRTGTDG